MTRLVLAAHPKAFTGCSSSGDLDMVLASDREMSRRRRAGNIQHDVYKKKEEMLLCRLQTGDDVIGELRALLSLKKYVMFVLTFQKYFLKKIKIFFSLLQINIFFVFSNYFNVLISKRRCFMFDPMCPKNAMCSPLSGLAKK